MWDEERRKKKYQCKNKKDQGKNGYTKAHKKQKQKKTKKQKQKNKKQKQKK
jgi:hypothetical protein